MQCIPVKKQVSTGRTLVRFVSNIVDLTMLGTLLLLLTFGIYALWDSDQILSSAAASEYEIYKPSAGEDSLSYEQLLQINSEVVGWLTVYGTGIDYPLVQAEDNEKYLTRTATGKNAASGALFLDYRSAPDFSDYNTIVYGHHMAESAMFGDIGKCTDFQFFSTHRYGNLYFDGKDHGIEFFMFLEIDAYDQQVYTPGITSYEYAQGYLSLLSSRAMYECDATLDEDERMILLSTCTSNITNGRDILVGKITDTVYENPYYVPPSPPVHRVLLANHAGELRIGKWPWYVWGMIALWLLLIAVAICETSRKRRSKVKSK